MCNFRIIYCTKAFNVLKCTLGNSMAKKPNCRDCPKICLNIY